MNIHGLADRYFSCVRTHDLDGLCAMYTADAVLLLPDNRELIGVEAIREMYRGLFSSQAPSPTPVNIIVGEHSVAAELEIRLPNGDIRRTANFFSLDDANFIKRLSIYARK